MSGITIDAAKAHELEQLLSELKSTNDSFITHDVAAVESAMDGGAKGPVIIEGREAHEALIRLLGGRSNYDALLTAAHWPSKVSSLTSIYKKMMKEIIEGTRDKFTYADIEKADEGLISFRSMAGEPPSTPFLSMANTLIEDEALTKENPQLYIVAAIAHDLLNKFEDADSESPKDLTSALVKFKLHNAAYAEMPLPIMIRALFSAGVLTGNSAPFLGELALYELYNIPYQLDEIYFDLKRAKEELPYRAAFGNLPLDALQLSIVEDLAVNRKILDDIRPFRYVAISHDLFQFSQDKAADDKKHGITNTDLGSPEKLLPKIVSLIAGHEEYQNVLLLRIVEALAADSALIGDIQPFLRVAAAYDLVDGLNTAVKMGGAYGGAATPGPACHRPPPAASLPMTSGRMFMTPSLRMPFTSFAMRPMRGASIYLP